MPTLDPTAIGALLISALLMLFLFARRHRGSQDTGRAPDSELLDTVASWPPQAVRVMTLPERLAYGNLRRALPKHLVLAQVPLSRFISVPTGNSYGQWLTRVGRLNVDLLVCDASSRVIAAVEVRPPGQTRRSIERHERLAQVLQAAGVKVHVWTETDMPSISAIRALFKTKGSAAGEDEFAGDGRHFIPVPEMQEILMEGDELDYNQANEPVPSGFFDDLDNAAQQRRAHA